MLENRERKKKYCWRFWPFFKQDYKYIASYLEEREKKGYRFCSLGCLLPVARYQKVEPQEAKYDVDIFRPKEYIEIQPYLDVCEDSGWEICWQWDEYKIFRGIDGKNPIPLQSDWEMKREQEKQIVKRNVRNSIFVFIWFCYIFFSIARDWSWPEFYLESYDGQFLIGIGIIGSFCVLLNRLWRLYNFYSNEKSEKYFNPNDMLCERKKWVSFFKIANCLIIGSVWGCVLFAVTTRDMDGGLILGWIIGISIVIITSITLKESQWAGEVRMKGVHTKKYLLVVMSLSILFSLGGYLCLKLNKESLPTGNFYMTKITEDDNFSSLWYGGTCMFETRTKQTADKMWILIDKEIREFERRLEEKFGNNNTEEIPLLTRKIMKKDQVKLYGDYDTGILYPDNGRILLRKGNNFCITNEKHLGEEAKNGERTIKNSN
ncbi:DUF2812 domain-containing protein [Anaerovorax sp. IOR16]|uniref:DUF2812 domain-containing protein n=1 Tax=Anaerovorax sp. IOR16 TaxID=2773458 RepID=UPI0019CFAA43|nr:DUF2812 domain-containing protein [Anaerovorax sp. IOR16]